MRLLSFELNTSYFGFGLKQISFELIRKMKLCSVIHFMLIFLVAKRPPRYFFSYPAPNIRKVKCLVWRKTELEIKPKLAKKSHQICRNGRYGYRLYALAIRV